MTDPLEMAWSSLPALVDRPTLARVIGLKRHDIDRVFDRCRIYVVSSKPYVNKGEARDCIEVREPAARSAA